MPPRWNWDFDDEPRVPPGTGSFDGRDLRPRQRRPRTRTIRTTIVLALIIALLAASSSHSGHSHAAAAARPPAHRVARAKPVTAQAATAAVLAYTPFVSSGGTGGRDVALTFDDGPGPYTPQVLTVLERMHVHATFFVIGEMLRYFARSAERELRDGDVIGDHTETHPFMARLSARDQANELEEQIARIELIGGPRPTLFRPPYGSFDATTMRELRRMHLLMVLWSDDTEDYRQPGVAAIVSRALEGAHPGAIILLHDAGGTRTETVAALPAIIRGIRARGLRLVTIPQLLHQDPPPHGLPLPPNLSGD